LEAPARTLLRLARELSLIELLFGLGFLSGVAPLATGIGSLLVGLASATSVFKAVYIDKLALNCACVGGNSKAPLGVVSFAENAIMAIMGASLIFSSIGTRELKSMQTNDITTLVIMQLKTSGSYRLFTSDFHIVKS
jgi:hypothetical protein